MPGKINPVIPEVVNQVSFYVMGNDMTITMAYAVNTFTDNCITGITANEERCRELTENSIGVITAVSPYIGYDKASAVAKEALELGKSVRALLLEKDIFKAEELDRILDPLHMTEPQSLKKDAP